MPTIRVEEDVMQGLKKIAEPFVDTPSSVIRRLLEERGVLAKASGSNALEGGVPKKTPNGKTTARRGSLTPQATYEMFVLHVLGTKLGGSAHKHDVTKAVVDLMKSRGFISTAELERVSTGETRADNTVAWARNALKERGLIKKLSIKGIWELTPEGMETAQHVLLPRRSTS